MYCANVSEFWFDFSTLLLTVLGMIAVYFAVFEWKEGDVRERRFLEYAPGSEKCMTEYIQTGHAQDMTTMVPTGRVFTR